tara:strand:- start:1078 stop:1515 length:438 start_codon:yes stop_codon:yes gene_type:complete
MLKYIILLPFAGLAATACTSTTSLGSSQELAPRLVASQPGDADMECDALSTEIAEMDALMAQSVQNARNAETSGATASAAAGAATDAALYSGALVRVPGLGFAANAAKGVAQRNAQAEAERQAENARTAELRRTALMGIYAGKGC